MPHYLKKEWWRGADSNCRTRWELIYSQPRLATSLPLQLLVPTIGIEPTTYWLQISCSANWAKSAIKKWWRLRGSNPRPSACKADALPAELSLHVFWTSFFAPFSSALIYNTTERPFMQDFFWIFFVFFIQMQNSLINKGLVPFSPIAFPPFCRINRVSHYILYKKSVFCESKQAAVFHAEADELLF